MLKNIIKLTSIKKNFISKKYLSTSANDILELPIIDYNKFLKKQEGWENECKKVAECLNQTGILVVKDPVKI